MASFPRGWWSFELDGARPGGGTYDLYPAEALPPIGFAVGPDFAFLPRTGRRKRGGPAELATLEARAAELGVPLPASFLAFFRDGDLPSAVPSCTACEWDLGAEPVPSPVEPGGYTLRFYRDQQDCLFWYLWLKAGEPSRVLCSPIPFDEVREPAEVVLANTWEVAPDLETFVARWWLENVLWERIDDGKELSPVERAYLDACRAADWGFEPESDA